MREKFNLEDMLVDIRRDEAAQAPQRRLLSQDEIQNMLLDRARANPSEVPAANPDAGPMKV